MSTPDEPQNPYDPQGQPAQPQDPSAPQTPAPDPQRPPDTQTQRAKDPAPIAGDLTNVDTTAKTLTVKTADGKTTAIVTWKRIQ